VVHRGEIALDKDGNEIRAAWPAIVPRELWEACRSVLAARTVGVRVERQRSVLRGSAALRRLSPRGGMVVCEARAC
jgi:hypothetical protein